MYREERERGITVQVLDMSSLEGSALKMRQEMKPDCYEARIYGGEIAVARDSNGTLYAICTEGVGYEVTKESPMELLFHGSYRLRDEETGEITSGSHSFDMMPFASIELGPDELLAYPVKEEKDLADFVRSFGARLEQNFWLWFNTLSK